MTKQKDYFVMNYTSMAENRKWIVKKLSWFFFTSNCLVVKKINLPCISFFNKVFFVFFSLLRSSCCEHTFSIEKSQVDSYDIVTVSCTYPHVRFRQDWMKGTCWTNKNCHTHTGKKWERFFLLKKNSIHNFK